MRFGFHSHHSQFASTGVLGTAAAATLVIACFALPASAVVLNFFMTVDGSQETPPVTTAATGTGTATLDTVTNVFSWNVTFSGLSSAQTLAHFHGNAAQCDPAGIQIGLPLGSPIVGSSVVSAASATAIRNGLWYVNIHTSTNPGGEIRGQVMPVPIDDPVPGPIAQSAIHVRLEEVATGLTAPNWGTTAPGDTARMFVTDQPGTLWAINTTTGVKTVFLDTTSFVVPMGAFGPGTFDERGLLGVAFHPSYQTNGLLYTYTSEPAVGTADFPLPVGVTANNFIVVAEWNVPNPTNPASVVNPLSRRVLFRLADPQFNHNAGCINFGPDGMLYIAIGDGGAADDQAPGHPCNGNGQDINSLFGKILRINPQGTGSITGQYGNPPTNPFVGVAGLDEIYAFGFRNPFRFSFDPVTGQLFAGDVGQNDIEEVDMVTIGGNYGWNAKEGSLFFVRNGAGNGYVTDQALQVPSGLINPIAQYDHDEGISVIGGFVYRGTAVATLAGRYVFAEFARKFDNDGRLFHLDATNQIREFQLIGAPNIGRSILGFGRDSAGELYVLANSSGLPFGTAGVVLKIKPLTGDLNNDGVVNTLDLGVLLSSWTLPPATACSGAACSADLNGDGVINSLDLGILLAAWTL